MPLQFMKANRICLKEHLDFSEKWVQARITEDLSILGLGDVELVTAEKIQPKAGRLDLLLHDDQLNRRYEVELMLGRTDPSHILRCIEYWDIERRRYPAYDHVAVLIAEDITSRFLNVMGLLSGTIPLIAVQLVALRVDDKIALHFVHVLDQTVLRSDDEYETGTGGTSGPVTTDRSYWESRVSPDVLKQCDAVCDTTSELTGVIYALRYRKNLIDIVPDGDIGASLWLIPKKTLVRIGGYVPSPEEWVKRFDSMGQLASLKRGNKAVVVSYKPQDIHAQDELLRSFLCAALGLDQSTNE